MLLDLSVLSTMTPTIAELQDNTLLVRTVCDIQGRYRPPVTRAIYDLPMRGLAFLPAQLFMLKACGVMPQCQLAWIQPCCFFAVWPENLIATIKSQRLIIACVTNAVE
jgi:hypothetical protein